MKKISLLILFLISVSLSCNDKRDGNFFSLKIYYLKASQYEKNLKLLEIDLKNESKDTLYVQRLDELQSIISTNIDTSNNATILLKNVKLKDISKEIVGTSFAIPEILFTDSAKKLDDYYKKFTSLNEIISQRKINSESYFEMLPFSTIRVHFILDFDSYNIDELDFIKIQKIAPNLQLVLKLKISNNLHEAKNIRELFLYSEESKDLLSSFNFN